MLFCLLFVIVYHPLMTLIGDAVLDRKLPHHTQGLFATELGLNIYPDSMKGRHISERGV